MAMIWRKWIWYLMAKIPTCLDYSYFPILVGDRSIRHLLVCDAWEGGLNFNYPDFPENCAYTYTLQ
jgi:hypothetical protein